VWSNTYSEIGPEVRCNLSWLLCWKITKCIHSSKPASLNCPIGLHQQTRHGTLPYGSLQGVQGMTVRTARLPRAGNLLGGAGEDLSGLPDWAGCYQFLFYFIDSIIYFNSSTRFRVTVAVFVLQFHNHNISFLSHHHQTNQLQCRSIRLACQCS